jgi:hypothetical protein
MPSSPSVSTAPELRRITPWSLDAAQPDYAPDGARILFRSNTTEKPGKPRNLWLVHPHGSGLQAVTHDSAGTAVWGRAHSRQTGGGLLLPGPWLLVWSRTPTSTPWTGTEAISET